MDLKGGIRGTSQFFRIIFDAAKKKSTLQKYYTLL